MKIIEYAIITRNSPEELEDHVNKLIEEGGWQPLGGVSKTATGDDFSIRYDTYTQAVVLYG